MSVIKKILSGFLWEGKMAFGVERPVSSKEYSSLAILFIEDFSEWYARLEGMTFLLMVRVVRRVFLVFVRGKTRRFDKVILRSLTHSSRRVAAFFMS